MDAESSGLGMIAVSGGVRKPNKRSDFRGAFKPMGSTVPHTMKNRGFRSKIFSWVCNELNKQNVVEVSSGFE